MIKLNRIICLLILGNCLFLSCKNNNPLISFKDRKDVAKISFEYSTMGHIVIECIIKKDTFNFIFDTGANMSIISPNIIPDDYVEDVSGIDIHNKTEAFKICKLKSMQCGEIYFKNLVVGKAAIPFEGIDGIIGRDVLNKLCIKIDNENKEILSAKKSNMIAKKGVKQHFLPSQYSVTLTLGANPIENSFLFDTGFVGNISIDSATYKSQFTENTTKAIWKLPQYGLFSNADLEEYSSVSYFLNNVSLDTITIKNVVFEYDRTKNKNLIGTVFMRQFKTVTIDYSNHCVFFEFPDDNSAIKFSNKHISNFHISSLNLLFLRINSMGIRFSAKPPYKISELLKDVNREGIEIGDTLIGIDETFFTEAKECKKLLKKTSYIETNISKQKELINKALNQKTTSIFHFIVKNKLVSIRFIRKEIVQPTPNIAYSFNDRFQDLSNVMLSVY